MVHAIRKEGDHIIARHHHHVLLLRTTFLGWLLIITLSGLPLRKCFSQPTGTKIPTKAMNLYLTSQKDVQMQNFNTAKKNLRESIRLWPGYAEAHQALADILRLSHVYDSAALHYREVLKSKPLLTPLAYFGLGNSLLGIGKYEEAEEAFQLFLSLADQSNTNTMPPLDPLKDPIFLSNKNLKDIRFSIKQLNRDMHIEGDVKILPYGLEINTSNDEYFPHFTADLKKLIFTRKVNDRENFFESNFDTLQIPTEAIPLAGKINSIDFNEGAHCVSPDGRYIFFTGCNRPGGLGSCDIYVSKKVNGMWSSPYNLGPPINTSGWEAQPSISADGTTLYFVSNRKGGYGGYDIWKSHLMGNGKWSDPINLGPEINTAFDESAPFIHADNQTLYFTSNGWPGFGKKDFFKASLKDGNWSEPINLGMAFNDHRDQSSITISMNGKRGVLASQRDLLRKDLDLYYFDVPSTLQPKNISYVSGKVIDSATLENITAKVTVFDLSGQKIFYDGLSDPEDGQFIAPLEGGKTYTLHIEKPGYLLYSGHYELQDTLLQQDAYHIEIRLKKIEVGKNEILKNIFFETNQAALLAESHRELDVLVAFLKRNSKIRIEIGGHTDNTGTKRYNDELSEKRAKAVWQYLMDANVHPERVTYKGYGADQPLADNHTSEGRKINRRTDFRIISN